MIDRVKKTKNIEILFNTETLEVLGDESLVTGVKIKNNSTKRNQSNSSYWFFSGYRSST